MSKLNNIKDTAKFLSDMYKYTDYEENYFCTFYLKTDSDYKEEYSIDIVKKHIIIAKRQLKLERILK